jgi:hypothetical protein
MESINTMSKIHCNENCYDSKLYNDIYFVIYAYLRFVDKIIFRRVCKHFRSFKLTTFYNIEKRYRSRLTNDILKQYKDIKQLDLRDNQLVTDLNYLTNLKKLNIKCNHVIHNEGIKELNLEVLIARGSNITKFNHMTNLKKLDIGCCFEVKTDDINKLNLEILFIAHNHNITDVNFMISLKKLCASGDCGVNDNGIKNLNLESLNVIHNTKIKNIDHMTKLKELIIGQQHKYLDITNVFNDGPIINLVHMRELKKLVIYSCDQIKKYIHNEYWKEIDYHNKFEEPSADKEFDFI